VKLRREQREKGSYGVIPYDGKVERELKKKREKKLTKRNAVD